MTTITKISVTRALAELKKLDEKIDRAISSGTFVSVTVGRDSNKKVYQNQNSVESVVREIQGSFDQVEQLMSNREKIKAAIVLSNAITKVKISGRELSVAEAIELKRSISSKQNLVAKLKLSYGHFTRIVENLNLQMEQSIDVSLNNIYGNEKGKVESSMYAAVAEPQRAQKEAALLDPKGIVSVIKKLEDEITDVHSELDFILSESNASTIIEVELI